MKILSLITFALCSSLSLSCAHATQFVSNTKAADVIYYGGPIVTLNDQQPTAQAVAVKNGKIVAVGSENSMISWTGQKTEQVFLDGKTLVPGFIDGHGHMVNVGLQAISANLLPPPDGGVDSIAALQQVLKDWIAKSPVSKKYGLIIGFGYDDSQLKEKRHPTKEELDMVSKDIPIMCFHQSGHIRSYNSKALEMAGITSQTKDPVGGIIQRKAGSQEPNGVFEESAMLLVDTKILPKVGTEEMFNLAMAGQELYKRFGHTTGQEGLAIAPFLLGLTEMANRKKLEIDVVAYPPIMFPGIEKAMQSLYVSQKYQNHLRIGGVKLVLDGSPQGKTAWLTKPYFKVPDGQKEDYNGYGSMPDADANRFITQAYANRWQILTHTNGDAAIDQLIEGIGLAKKKYPNTMITPVMIHGQVMRADQIPKLKQLGIFPSVFPMHTFYWGDWHRDSVLGPERAANISPTKWLQDAKIPFSSHHDAPVANPDMMRVLSATVNRTTRSGQTLGPDQRVEPVVGLKSISLWAAMQYGEGKSKGSIEVGKLADLVVLSDNPTTMDRLKIADVKVLKTIKEGKTIYELKPSTQANHPSSCMASDKCQEMIANLGPQAGFAQLLPHNHNH
ncbi:amidohydrolase [Polynucleobacter sp. SHI8]|uniref:amidohydrolase n=1 Tax=unclassified Polynucleobacter TaxID=2640945 RepID=UPI0024902B66|nr:MULTISPECIES: amidohydrolase [unclassified Polynucleobacter]BDW11439.1 amidohydrolase [Polynucleobacter sp. SHI2]BDW13886.1 amidohydrolase [Polynucleobacter sp. SHI8]